MMHVANKTFEVDTQHRYTIAGLWCPQSWPCYWPCEWQGEEGRGAASAVPKGGGRVSSEAPMKGKTTWGSPAHKTGHWQPLSPTQTGHITSHIHVWEICQSLRDGSSTWWQSRAIGEYSSVNALLGYFFLSLLSEVNFSYARFSNQWRCELRCSGPLNNYSTFTAA